MNNNLSNYLDPKELMKFQRLFTVLKLIRNQYKMFGVIRVSSRLCSTHINNINRHHLGVKTFHTSVNSFIY